MTHLIKLVIVCISFFSIVYAEELPLWELGLGVGGLHQAYYVGTKDTRNFAFPVPLPVYRGDIFKSDEDGLRAQLLDEDRYTLDLSLDFNLAIDSDDVDLREGMDDVDSMLQIGPSLKVALAKTDNSLWELGLPLRANFGIDSGSINESGYTFSPTLAYFRYFKWGAREWRAGVSLGPQFGSHEYQNVYYGVDDKFATAIRPAYRAESGYSGSRLQTVLRSRDQDRLWVWFLRYDNIEGAKFDDSPLVETDDAVSFGVIYSRFLFKSQQTVTRKR